MSKDYQYSNNSIKELAGFYIMAVHRIDLQIKKSGLDPEKEWAKINQEFSELKETDSEVLVNVEIVNDKVKIINDKVNSPTHYNQGEFEVIDILQDKLTKEEFEGFLKGNILKYTFREGSKNGTEDMKKAAWYTNRLIKFRG